MYTGFIRQRQITIILIITTNSIKKVQKTKEKLTKHISDKEKELMSKIWSIEYKNQRDQEINCLFPKKANEMGLAIHNGERENKFKKAESCSLCSIALYQKNKKQTEEINTSKIISDFPDRFSNLISIILQTLLMQITSQFLTGDRSQKFMIIVDEAWHLLEFSAGFLAAIARNLRRYGGNLVVCTQCFADLQTLGNTEENNGHRQAIFQNSAWKVILLQDSTTDFEAHSDFKEKIPLLKSLSFERGEYSEMLLS